MAIRIEDDRVGRQKAAPLYIRTDHLVRVVCVTNDVWELEPKGARWSLGLDGVDAVR